MTIGFIGTGNIASALVRGLCTVDLPPPGILVSPRNAEKASRLVAEFARVRVAQSNQALVDRSDCVVLAILPKAAEEVLGALAFRTEQRIISWVALTSLARVHDLVHPAKTVVVTENLIRRKFASTRRAVTWVLSVLIRTSLQIARHRQVHAAN